MRKPSEIQHYRTLLQSAVWQPATSDTHSLSAAEKAWLLGEDSLTAKLKRHCHHFRVELLNQSWQQALLPNEGAVLPPDQAYLIREVFLYGDQQRWVFARTVIPAALCQQFPQLQTLGEKSLGEFLFEQKLARGELQWSKLNTLSARRSLFSDATSGLLVTELFLDDFGYV
ncbi:chorismate--pyruvate lyase family protein [Testudinibacter sp. P27/CKL/0425]